MIYLIVGSSFAPAQVSLQQSAGAASRLFSFSSSSCHDGFRLRGGLLPQRGGEGVQTDQRRDRETTAARQERRQAGAEAAAAGYVTAGGPPGPRELTPRENTDANYGYYLLYLCLWKLRMNKSHFCCLLVQRIPALFAYLRTF